MSEYLFVRDGWTPVSSIAMPAALAKQVKWDETLSFGDDSDFAIRAAATGVEFYMHDEALVIVDDDERPGRLSRSTNWRATKKWLDRIRPLITHRAYLCYLGSQIARQAALAENYAASLWFYRMAIKVMPVSLKERTQMELWVAQPQTPFRKRVWNRLWRTINQQP
jgi:hypothetical protein